MTTSASSPSNHDGEKRDSEKRDGANRDGANHDGANHDGAKHDGAPHDPAASENAPHDPAEHDLGFDLPPPASPSKKRLVAGAAILVTVLGAAFLTAYIPRRRARAALEEDVKQTLVAAPRLEVLTPKLLSSDRSLVLTGSVQPLEETVIYPRASGFVRKWSVDIGDKVKEGQVLAEIDAPELDQELSKARAQLAQTRAQLAQTQANRDLSQTNLNRSEQLVAAGVAAQQELDQRKGQVRIDEANVGVAQANINAQQAEIRRLTDLRGFTKITAPFAGTVTSRTAERGMLVSAGGTNPLFKLSVTDPVRVFVSVPQDVAPGVKTEQPASVTIREFPGKPFQGIIARTSGSLDPLTRTMNVEVRVPNPDGKLLTGMYSEVALTLPIPHRILEVPATAIFNDSKGMRLAIVTADNKIHFVPITIERDTGATFQISAGLEGSERVVKLANAELTEGMAVELLQPASPPPR